MGGMFFKDPGPPIWDFKTGSDLGFGITEWLYEDTYWPIIHFIDGFIVQYYVGNWKLSLLLMYLYETIEAIITVSTGDLMGADPESLGGSLISDIAIGFSGAIMLNMLAYIMGWKYHRIPHSLIGFDSQWRRIIVQLILFFGGTLAYWLPKSYFGSRRQYSWGFMIWNLYVPIIFLLIAWWNTNVLPWLKTKYMINIPYFDYQQGKQKERGEIIYRSVQTGYNKRDYWNFHITAATFICLYALMMEIRVTHVFLQVAIVNAFLILSFIGWYLIKDEMERTKLIYGSTAYLD